VREETTGRDGVRGAAPDAGLRALWALPGWRRWLLASFLARLPLTMTLLALQLAGQEATGSLAVGAVLAGVATGTSGLAATLRGRRLDRGELRGGLRRAAAGTAAVFLAQAAALSVGAPVAVLFVLAAVQGVVGAAVQGGFRALLTPVVPRALLARGSTLDAVFVEAAFVAGPALAGVLALVIGARGVLVAMAAAALAAAVVTGGLPRVPPAPAGGGAAAPWRSRAALAVYALTLAGGLTLGMLESAVAALAEDLGVAAALAGPLLTLTAVGSAVGGIVAAGRITTGGPVVGPAAALFAAMGVLLLPVAGAPSIVLLGAALFLVGIPIAPLNALGALRLQVTIDPGRQAEGFATYTAAVLIGAGLGQALTGLLLAPLGARGLLAAAVAVPIAATAALVARPPRQRR